MTGDDVVRFRDLETHLKRLDYLRDLFDTRIEALEAKVDEANATARLAIDRASVANEKRFDASNEWRGSLNDVINKCVSRAEWDADRRNGQDRTSRLEKMVWMLFGGLLVIEFVSRFLFKPGP